MSKLTVASSPHHHNQRDTGQVMKIVMLATIPGVLAQYWFFGPGIFIQILLAVGTAIVAEAVILEIRGKNTKRALSDYSAALAGLLLAICLPPLAPWWIAVVGASFAIIVVKQLYGGLGYNMFNPAMAAYVVLLISFPVQMTSWLPPIGFAEQSVGIWDAIHTIFTGFSSDGYSINQLRVDADGITMATPLDHVKTQLTEGYTIQEAVNYALIDGTTGIGWGVIASMYLLGGLALLKLRIINWHMPMSMIAGAMFVSLILNVMDNSLYASMWFHLVNGSLIFGAFFICTDPVSGSTTNNGRLIFGFAIGIWVILIRVFGNYPDAVAFAVIIMNMAVPLIDYYTRPRTYGHSQKTKRDSL